jgi:hypothetical protein
MVMELSTSMDVVGGGDSVRRAWKIASLKVDCETYAYVIM